jgi:hypothetical protein
MLAHHIGRLPVRHPLATGCDSMRRAGLRRGTAEHEREACPAEAQPAKAGLDDTVRRGK